MSTAVRHQPSLDLQHKSSVESFYSVASVKALEPPAKSADRAQMSSLRLATSTPVLQKRYHSDEEQPSPGMEEDFSEGSSGTGDLSEIEIDESIDLDDIEPVQVVSPRQLATAISIVFTGKPSLIDVSTLAPMAKRSRPALSSRISSHTSIHNAVMAVSIPPRPQHRRGGTGNNRSLSMYEPPVVVDHVPTPKFSTPNRPTFLSSANSSVTNFSAPLRNLNRARPSPLVSHRSSRWTDSSSPPQLSESFSPVSSVASSETDEAEALLRESAEIQFRTRSKERERQLAWGQGYLSDGEESDPTEDEIAKETFLDESPTPTSYQAYDPFALDPPHLSEPMQTPTGRRGSAAAAAAVAKKGWKGLVRGRVGRRGAIAT